VLKNGQVSESGNYQELLAKKGDFAEFLISHIQEERAEDEEGTRDFIFLQFLRCVQTIR
jgi:ABC-type transport system involved in Fe-S cluster assembly, permease and ATPase components